MQLWIVRARVRWLAWRYRRISEQRRRLRDKIMHISDEQAKLWYQGELLKCKNRNPVSR